MRAKEMLSRGRLAVADAARPMVCGLRAVDLASWPVTARVAVLVELAGTAAALARAHAAGSHVDPAVIAHLVSDPVDAFAVLGRGRWLPTMQRRVLAAPNAWPVSSSRPARVARRVSRRAITTADGQLTLFSSNSDSGRGGVL